jgi:hypothetical protein
MNFSENIIQEIQRLSSEHDISIFDSAVKFCEDNDLEISDFIKSIDLNTLEIIRMSAIDENILRKKDRPKERTLVFG